MKICKEYNIYLEEDIQQFVSLPDKIELLTTISGPSAVVVYDNIYHHLYIDNTELLVKNSGVQRDKIVLYDKFRSFSEFEKYLSNRGIYVAYFDLQELSNIIYITHLGMHRIMEQLPYTFRIGSIYVLLGRLYNVIRLFNITNHPGSGDIVLFIRNVDIDEILDYYTYIMSKILDAYGKVDIDELLKSNIYYIYRLGAEIKEEIESSFRRLSRGERKRNEKNIAIVRSLYDIVEKIYGIIDSARL